MAKKLFELYPNVDIASLSRAFATDGRVQVRDVLTQETAEALGLILSSQTPWDIARFAITGWFRDR